MFSFSCGMTTAIDVVDLSSDDELEVGGMDAKPVKLEAGLVGRLHLHKMSETRPVSDAVREFEDNWSSVAYSTNHSSSSTLDRGQRQSLVDDTGLSSVWPACPPPLCRQFWKAGNYNDSIASKVTFQEGNNYLHVHPMFLHSNATSHKWAFGAMAELLDNAVDEIQNEATFVIVDKTSNPRDGSPALLIQDNGSGMDPDAMRRCMSFGFSEKKSKSAIGKYGNGFKTSTMRLGADVIVFNCHQDNGTLTQSIGLLSYTFLARTGRDRIVVPMVHYEFNSSSQKLEIMHEREQFMSNLSMLLQWSPYGTETELLKQFNDIGAHGTKVYVYNLWFNDDGNVELDFDTDPEDISISGDTRKIGAKNGWKAVNEEHIANRFHYSLRVYLSILYLRIPETFQIVLCGQVVQHHNIANDLKYPESILYRPQSGGSVEGEVLTTIGFVKEAPYVSVHGFNVYHKNRLILPYWQVLSYKHSRGRGVVGVLEANFMEPSHNKQDFEKTSLFQKLEARLRDMTWEYWDLHCRLIGYHPNKKLPPQVSSACAPRSGVQQPVTLGRRSLAVGSKKTLAGESEQSRPNSQSISEKGGMKRKYYGNILPVKNVKVAEVVIGKSQNVQNVSPTGNQLKDEGPVNLLQENKRLLAKCLEYEKREEELNLKAKRLRSEIKELDDDFCRMLGELESLGSVKDEKGEKSV